MKELPTLHTSTGGGGALAEGDDCHYEIILPKTSEGFMLRLGASQFLGYHASFSSYRRHASGAKSFAETHNLFRNSEDTFIKIDGVDMLGKSFDEVVRFITDKSLFQDSLRVLMLDLRAYEASRANQASNAASAPEDTTLAESELVPERAAELVLPFEACDETFSLNKEDEVILQKAIEEDGCDPAGSVKLEKTPPAMSTRAGRNQKNIYDVMLPKTPEGFMFLLNPLPNGKGDGYTTSFYGYHRHQDGSLSEAETKRVFRNIGDILISVNRKDLKGIPPGDVFGIINDVKDKEKYINLQLNDVGTSLNKRGNPNRFARVFQATQSRDKKTVTQTNKGQRQSKPTADGSISEKDVANSNYLTNPNTNRRQSEPPSLKQMVENIPAPEPELAGLGWIRQGFMRTADKGHIDRYWITPVTQKKLRSRVEITKFLSHLARNNGNEDEAFHLLKSEYSKRKGRRESVGKSSTRRNSMQISTLDKNADRSQEEVGDKLGELHMEQRIEKVVSDEIVASATGVEDCSSIHSNPCSKEGATSTPSKVPLEREVEEQKIIAKVTKEVTSLGTVTNTISDNNTASDVPPEQVIESKMTATNFVKEVTTLPTIGNAMRADNIYLSSPEVPIEQAAQDNVTKGVSFLCTVTQQEVGNEWSHHKITADGTKVAANISAASHVSEDRVQTESTKLYPGFEAEQSGNSSSLISIDLENVTLKSPGKNVSVPIVTAEPVSICSPRELRKMPVAFAFELEDKESARNAKAAQLLWYSSLLSESQRQGYIEQNVFQGSLEKINSVGKASQAAKKHQEDESERSKFLKQKTSQGMKGKRRIESKAPPKEQVLGRPNKRKKLKTTPKSIPTSSSEMNNAVLIEEIPAPEPGLSGWTRRSYKRKSNQSHIDRYWFTPKAGIRLRSRPECMKYLKHLEKSNGDEVKAYESFRKFRG